MANIITTGSPAATPVVWVNPSNVGGDESGIPVGLIRHQIDLTVPLKTAGNVSQVIVNMSLPRNFVYRMNWINITLQCVDVLQFNTSLSLQMFVQQDAAAPRYLVYMSSVAILQGPAVLMAAFNLDNESAADPTRIYVDARAGNANVEIQIMDANANETAAAILRVSCAHWIYTVDALNSWRFHTPSLVTGV